MSKFNNFFKKTIVIYSIIIFICGFFTFFQGYDKPEGLFWDENYHIASAQRYLQGKFFMEPHPPFGKLLIALGEKIVHPNQGLDVSKMVGAGEGDGLGYIQSLEVKWLDPARTDEAKFNFSGVRLFPVLAAWACCLLILWIVYSATKNPHIAFLITFAYTFDNSIITHSRGAMIDSIQLFFILCSTLTFVKIWTNQIKFNLKNLIILCSFISLAFAVKMNSLIVLLYLVFLMVRELWMHKYRMNVLKSSVIGVATFLGVFGVDIFRIITTPKGDLLIPMNDITSWVVRIVFGLIVFFITQKFLFPTFDTKEELNSEMLKSIETFGLNWAGKFGVFILIFFLIVGGAYQVHFGLTDTMIAGNDFIAKIEIKELTTKTVSGGDGKTVTTWTEEPNLEKAKAIQDRYYAILDNNQTWNPSNFVFQMQEQLRFVNKFQKGVPSLDLKKGDDEAGSYPIWWMVGARTVANYRSSWSPIEGKAGSNNYKDFVTNYLTPAPNIVVWWSGLAGIILALSLFISKYFWKNKNLENVLENSLNSNKINANQQELGSKSPQTYFFELKDLSPVNIRLSLIACFTSCYIFYMITMSSIDRVLYIYHYYFALVIALITFGLVIDYYLMLNKKPVETKIKNQDLEELSSSLASNNSKFSKTKIAYLISLVLIFGNFVFIAPFTYALPITVDQFNQRNVLKYIGLRVNKNMESK